MSLVFGIPVIQASSSLSLIPIVGAIVGYFIAVSFNKRVHATAGIKKAMRKKAQWETEIDTASDVDELIEWIPMDPSLKHYDFYGADKATGTLVFGTKHGGFSNGFYHRVFATKDSDGAVVLHIETMSKSIQIGPVVRKSHNTFADAIEWVVEKFDAADEKKTDR